MGRIVAIASGLLLSTSACGTRTSPSQQGGDREEPDTDAGGDDPGPRIDAGGFGASRECYGIADDLGELFAIDRATGQATHLCSVPAGVDEIDAISSHPVTGIYYYVSRSEAGAGTLGWFLPDACEFHPIGPVAPATLSGLSFHPATGDLYGADEDTLALYRFGRDADGAPTADAAMVADLPFAPSSLAIQPGSGTAFIANFEALQPIDLATGAAGDRVALDVARVQAMFFTVDGQLLGTVDGSGTPPDRFVSIDPAVGVVTDLGGLNPVAYLPGTTARPPANDVEAMDCNVGGACSGCVE